MIEAILPNIPRHYTAFAEWMTCIVFIMPLIKRKNWQFTLIIMGIGQIFLQVLVGQWPLQFWLLGMGLNILWMYLTIYTTSNIGLKNVAYVLCKAFILAEFIASFAWQIYCHLFLDIFDTKDIGTLLINLFFYIIILTFVYLFEKRSRRIDVNYDMQTKNVLIAAFTAIIIFTISNVGFMLSSTTYFSEDPLSIFMVRTLINFSGVCILYMQESLQYEVHLQKELKAVNNIFQNHYEQYVAYKDSTRIIEQKVHDLKHQIEVIRMEPDKDKKETYLDEMTQAINTFSASIQTGNGILDTILSRKNSFCIEQDIQLTCIVDGQLLNDIDTMDICSLFGNALDNAIDAVLNIPDKDQRLINLRVFKRGEFLMISLENYIDELVDLTDGLPRTTKSNTDYHGYGLKSIAYIAEKYDGNMNVSIKDHWFSLKVLLPLSS